MATQLDCIFCQIVQRHIPAQLVHEDDDTVAFVDINPQAPQHFLVIPKNHVVTASEVITAGDEALFGKMVKVAATIAAQYGFVSTGYRLVVNSGRDGGQTVRHLHLHVLGGRTLGWPPG